MAEHLFLVLPEPKSSISPTSDILQQESTHSIGLVTEFNRIFWLLDIEDFEILYDRNNLREYFKFFKEEKGDYYTHEKAVRALFYKGEQFKQWNATTRKTPLDMVSVYYVPQSMWNTLCEVAKRIADGMEIPMAVLKYDVDKLKMKSIPAEVNGNHLTLQVVQLSFEGIAEWLETHRVPERHYQWNSKHGEFGKGAHAEQKGRGEVSVLMSGRETPKKLLPKAIGHRIVRGGESHDNLYVYDEQYSMFLRFVFDSTTRTYHAFHIQWEKLPEDIKKKFRVINPEVTD